MLEILVDENPHLSEKNTLGMGKCCEEFITNVEWFQQLSISPGKKPESSQYNDRETTSIAKCNNK